MCIFFRKKTKEAERKTVADMIREQKKKLTQDYKGYITELPIFAEPGVLFCYLHEDVAAILNLETPNLRLWLHNAGFVLYHHVEEDKKYKVDFDGIAVQFGYENHYVVSLENIGTLRNIFRNDNDIVQKIDAMENALEEYAREKNQNPK